MNKYFDLAAFRGFARHIHAAEPKPMADEGLQPTYRLGAKPCTYQPSPTRPPRSGKRKRQWR